MGLAQALPQDTFARRVSLIVLIALAIGYPLLTDVPDGLPLIERLQGGLDPARVADFNLVLGGVIMLLGMWPVAMAGSLYLDERRNARWGFLAAFLLAQTGSPVPVLAYRLFFGPVKSRTRPAGRLSAWLESRAHLVLFTLIWALGVAMLVRSAQWSEYLWLFRTDRAVHMLTWNLFLWCAMYGIVSEEDRARRPGEGERDPSWRIVLLRIPLLNVLVHFWTRKKLPDPI